MTKFYWPLYILLFIQSNTLWSKSLFADLASDYNSMTNCQNHKQVEEEFEKLFKVIKNDIVGVKPRFCEDYKKNTLNEQVNNHAHNEFDQFMDLLDKIPTTRKNTSDLLAQGTNAYKDVFFEVTRMTTLKKHWQFLSSSEKEKVLFDEDCARIQINKMPFVNKNIKLASNHVGHERMNEICRAKNIDEVIKYVDKDIMAETFLNLKKLFPENYSQMVQYFCDDVMDLTDALTINYNDSSIKMTTDIFAESESFSQWLLNSSKEVANKNEYFKKLSEVSYKEESNSSSMGGFDVQKEYKKIYDGKKEGEKVIYPFNNNYEIKKLPNQTYVAKIINKELGSLYNNEQSLKKQVGYFTSTLEKKEFQSEQITYAKKGSKIEFSFVDGIEKELVSKVKENQKNIDLGLLKKKEFDLGVEGQKILKAAYEAYSKPEEKDDLFYPLDKNPIFINKEGMYESSNNDDYLGNTFHKQLFDEYSKHIKPKKVGAYEVVMTDKFTYVVKDNKNNYTSINLYPKTDNKSVENSFEAYDPSEEEGMNMDQYNSNSAAILNLRDAVNSQYQKTENLVGKMNQLNIDELSAVRSYTGSAFSEMNSCLRASSCEKETQEKIDSLKGALDKLSNQDRLILYRGVKSLPDNIQKDMDSNKEFILDKGFVSTSGSMSVAKGFAGDYSSQDNPQRTGKLLMIKSKNCVGISSFSHFKSEDEFICPPGLKFKATKVVGTNQYILEEVER